MFRGKLEHGFASRRCLGEPDTFLNVDSQDPLIEQLARLLQALAAVTSFTSAPFERYLISSLPKVPYGATLVIVTGLVTPDLVDSLVQLKRYRAHTMLISLEKEAPPEIPGVRLFHLPFEQK